MEKSILKVEPVAFDDVDLDVDVNGFLEQDDDHEWDQDDLNEDDFSIEDLDFIEDEDDDFEDDDD